MKKLGQIFASALVGVSTLSIAQSASATGIGSFSYPSGQVIYSYTTPSVSIYGAVQVGNYPSVTVTQNSAHNLAVIGQVGTSSKARVTQTGSMNSAQITQVGRYTNALTIQFGSIESIIGQ